MVAPASFALLLALLSSCATGLRGAAAAHVPFRACRVLLATALPPPAMPPGRRRRHSLIAPPPLPLPLQYGQRRPTLASKPPTGLPMITTTIAAASAALPNVDNRCEECWDYFTVTPGGKCVCTCAGPCCTGHAWSFLFKGHG